MKILGSEKIGSHARSVEDLAERFDDLDLNTGVVVVLRRIVAVLPPHSI